MVKIKNYRSADCVVGGFRDKSIGSTRNELLLGLYNSEGKLHYVGTASVDAKAGGWESKVKETEFLLWKTARTEITLGWGSRWTMEACYSN